MFFLFWLLPVPALLSEWKLTVDGKAAAVAHRLRAHRLDLAAARDAA